MFDEKIMENEKLNSQNQQMNELALDFNAMVLNRDESKKQLEAKFDDLQKKLAITKEYLQADKKRIFYTLEAFKSKYSTQINKLDQKFDLIMNEKKQASSNLFKDQMSQLEQLQRDVEKEKEERVQWNEQNLKQVREEVENLENNFKQEKTDRINSQKKIIRKLDDNNFNLSLKLSNQNTERNLIFNEYKAKSDKAIANLSKQNEKFNTNVTEELKHILNNIDIEFNGRLSSQNNIIDNLSNLMSTLQDTLKLFAN